MGRFQASQLAIAAYAVRNGKKQLHCPSCGIFVSTNVGGPEAHASMYRTSNMLHDGFEQVDKLTGFPTSIGATYKFHHRASPVTVIPIRVMTSHAMSENALASTASQRYS